MRRTLPVMFLIGVFLFLAAAVLAQSPTPVPPTATVTPLPPTDTPAPTPTLTPAPVIVVVQATPLPKPQGDLLTETWNQYKFQIVLSVVTLILIGVFLKQISEKLIGWAGRALDRLSRRFANWAYFRRRNWRKYVAALNRETEAWQTLHGANLRMEDIYVAVQLTDLPAIHTRYGPAADEEQVRRQRRQSPLEPRQAAADFRCLAVIGEPGAGKTTLLRWLAWLYANERAETPPPPAWLARFFARRGKIEAHALDRPALPRWLAWLNPIGRVPVLIPLRDLPAEGDLASYLPVYFEKHDWPGAGDFIRQMLERGDFLLLLDALDEVDDPAKLSPLAEKVADFAVRYSNDEHPNWIVLSSRPQSYRQCALCLPCFKPVEVLEFEPPQVRAFLDNWFRATPSQAEALWSQLAADERLLELAANPLLLTFITEAYEQTAILETRRRAGLFGEIVTVRMEEWDRKRGIRRGFRFMRPEKEGFLQRTALRLNSQPRSVLPRDELLEEVRDFLRAGGQVNPDAADAPHDRTLAERFLWEIAEGSGLLHERAIAHYDFSHKTLREYFTAAELRDSPDGEATLLRALQAGSFDRWGMVAVLYAGLRKDASTFVRAVWGRNPALTADGLLLAAHCLRDAASTAADPALRDDLAAAIVAALPSAEPVTQYKTLPLLRALHPAQPDRLVAHARRLSAAGQPALAAHLLSDAGQPALAARLLSDAPEAEQLRRELGQSLLQILQTGDAPARAAAMSALSIVGGAPEAAAPLLRDLEAADPALRAEAARTLAALRLPDRAVLAALRTRRQADPDLDARAAATLALLQLGQAEALGMVYIPAGEFLMGTPPEQARQLAQEYGYSETDFDDETPQRAVRLPDYWIGQAPVTNRQYKEFLDANPRHGAPYVDETWAKPYNWDPETRTHPSGLADHPAVLVSWEDAAAYARWAGLRLPTEAEWEKAARGGLQIGGEDNPGPARLWPWGDEWDPARCNSTETWAGRPLPTYAELKAWWEGDFRKEFSGKRVMTKPVGAYPAGASPYGVLDMAGNVWEWTADWYQGYPGTNAQSAGFGQKYRVLRGGGWNSSFVTTPA